MKAAPNEAEDDVAGDGPRTDGGVWSRLSLHEFLVDFFGGLVPGVLFTVVVAASLCPAIDALSAALHRRDDYPSPWALADAFLKATAQTPSMIWIALFSFVLMLGYVVGHLFLRRDPKEPDVRSFRKLRNLALKERRAEPVTATWLRENFACSDEKECQFPYQHMNDYLRARGHEHLARIADNWSGESRSKTYLNRLKLRLAYHSPAKYRPVVRNEAHVRLVTSTWYMADSLWKVALICSVPLLCGAAVIVGRQKGSFLAVPEWLFDSAVPTLFAVAGGLFARNACEKFLHYQRLREVYVVLELAYTAHHSAPILEQQPKEPGGLLSEPPVASGQVATR